MEIFRKIKDYQNYEVSNLGRVRSLNHWTEHKDGKLQFFRGKELKLHKTVYGYYQTTLTENGVQKVFSVHRLVAETFIPNPDNLPCVNHKNEVKDDNRVENLEWCDYEYNNNYGTKPERLSNSMKGRIPWNKGVPMRDDIREKLIGRTFSDEHKKHLSESQKKRVRSEEELQRCRTQCIGKYHTEETKKKMSEARRRYWEKRKSINN